jgi:hypothetical protein
MIKRIENTCPCILELVGKINELIKNVNELRRREEWHLDLLTESNRLQHMCKKPADPDAEQRKWVGNLCRFWDDDVFETSKDWAFGILTSIDKGMQYQYCCNEICNFKHCEPVKPDDAIICKGK